MSSIRSLWMLPAFLALAACGGGSGGPPPPAAPVITAVSPASPANQNAPVLSGTSAPSAAIAVYTTATCTGAPVATATATAAGAFTVAVDVPDDSQTTFRATASAGGATSACSAGVLYVEDSTSPAPPASAATTPASPANQNLPVLSGTAEAGATVRIFAAADCAGTPVATGTAAAGAFAIAAAVADDTTTAFGLVAVDAAGNASACAAGPVFEEDSTPPAAPAVVQTEPPSPSNAASVLVRGTAQAGAAVTLHADAACGAVLGTATAATDGAWSIGAIVAENATTTLHARATDEAGNGSGCSAGLTYVEDSVAPAAPALAAPASPSSVNAVQLTGVAEAGATVRLFDGTACAGTPAAIVPAGPGGAFAFDRTVAPDATATWVASATDAAGNISGCSAAASYVEDSTPPAAPVAAAVTPAGPANQNLPVVSGTAEPGATVQLFTSATCAGAAAGAGTASGGAFSVPAAVGDDTTTTFGVVAVDAAGNASACAAGPTFVEDSTPPASPAVTATEPPSPSNVSTVLVRGTSEPGVTITLHLDGACAVTSGTTVAGPGGAWSIGGVVVPTNTTTAIRARAVDGAGNGSACSGGLSFVHDSTIPTTPTLVAPPSPSNVNAVRLTGTTDAGATVRLFDGNACAGTPVATTTAGPGGAFAFDRTVAPDATATWVAAAANAAGNVSGCSAVASYVEDSTPPAAPVAATVAPTSPANENLPVVSGSAEAQATVRVFGSGTCAGAPIGTGTATAGGTYAVAAAVVDDTTTTFGVIAVDAAGNLSTCTAGPTFVEDSTPPAAPAVTATTPASPSSASVVLVSGTGEPGTTVVLHGDPACSGAALGTSALVSAGGTWSVPAVLVVENFTTTFHAKATDAADNGSACSAGLAYVEDSAPPATPTLATAPASPSNLNDLALTGTAEAQSTVRIFLGATCQGAPAVTASASAAGTFSVPRTVAADSTTTWVAEARDAADNASACSAPATYVEDSTPPAAPVVAAATVPPSPSNDPTPLVSGTAEALATIRVYSNATCTGTPLATTAATAGGTFSTLVPATPNTTTTFRASATDAAGNGSACAVGPSYAHDDVPPAFAGLTSATGVGAGIQLTWTAATDGGTPPAQVRYDICQSTTFTGCTTAFTATVTVTGVTTATVPVAAGTRGFFLVRARDLLGNRDANTVVLTGKTLGDGVAGVASGDNLTCVLDSAGGVACTGDNARGQLGNGQFDVGGGTQVVNLPAAVAISAGERHVCALAQDGSVWCWGDNVDGAVAQDPLVLPRINVATQVTLPGAARAVACGRRLSCALLADGTEWCWGFNDLGQLGGGLPPPPPADQFSATPVQVSGLTDAVAIAPGESHGCALTAGGVVRCWGAGGNGQLGQGTGLDSPTPVTFGATVPAATGFKALAAGWRHTCALTAAGVLYCAGENRVGQVGIGGVLDQLAPVVVPGLPADVNAVALGADHSCVLADSGQPFCWGEDRFEQLGDGAGAVDQPLAVQVLGTGWPTLIASHQQTCLLEDGVARCWGLGGSLVEVATPTALPGLRPEQAIALAAGRNHTCALLSDGEIRCFGAGDRGQLGGGLVADANQPVDTAVGAGALVAGGDVTCFATAAGRSCLGANEFGQLRDGTDIDRSTPVAPQPGWPAAMSDHACAVDQSTGEVLCWGRNDLGQLGIGITTPSAPANAIPVGPTPDPVRAVTNGATHACALLRDGTVGCWGDQRLGQLGDPGVTGLRAQRGPVPGLAGVAEVDAGGGDTTCARLASGAIQCWGANGSGQVGDGTTVPRGSPTAVSGITTAIDVAVGPNHACAVLAGGTVRCWGSNVSGALGDGTTVDRPAPVTVTGLAGAKRVVVGEAHSCALTGDGRALCWGGNARGQVGDGSTTSPRLTPTPLAGYP